MTAPPCSNCGAKVQRVSDNDCVLSVYRSFLNWRIRARADMTEVNDLVRDLINLTSPMFRDEAGIVEGLVESIDKGLQRMIVEGGKVSFSITQKGKEYVEAMPFPTLGGTQ